MCATSATSASRCRSSHEDDRPEKRGVTRWWTSTSARVLLPARIDEDRTDVKVVAIPRVAQHEEGQQLLNDDGVVALTAGCTRRVCRGTPRDHRHPRAHGGGIGAHAVRVPRTRAARTVGRRAAVPDDRGIGAGIDPGPRIPGDDLLDTLLLRPNGAARLHRNGLS